MDLKVLLVLLERLALRGTVVRSVPLVLLALEASKEFRVQLVRPVRKD